MLQEDLSDAASGSGNTAPHPPACCSFPGPGCQASGNTPLERKNDVLAVLSAVFSFMVGTLFLQRKQFIAKLVAHGDFAGFYRAPSGMASRYFHCARAQHPR